MTKAGMLSENAENWLRNTKASTAGGLMSSKRLGAILGFVSAVLRPRTLFHIVERSFAAFESQLLVAGTDFWVVEGQRES